MSKFLKIPNGDYKVAVQPGGTITLDTGDTIGQVVITGDLVVQGETTTLNTSELFVEDKILKLNNGETGFGISGVDVFDRDSGIQIDRGQNPDVYFLFDESVNEPFGSFILRDHNRNLMPLTTNFINTEGGNLNLIGSGNGVVSVSGTSNYEDRVIDDDDIPNKRWVEQELLKIGDSVTVSGLADFDTEMTIRDSVRSDINDSRIRFTIDSVNVAQIDGTRAILHGLVITDTTIEVKNPSPLQGVGYDATDMILKHPDSSSSVLIDTTLGLKPVNLSVFPPDVPAEGVRIYSSVESIGGTGIYFVNEEGTRDEMVSRSRAILYGIIF